MKKIFKPANLAFIVLIPVVFFVIGIYLAGLFNAGRGQGLAAGAIVLGWGFITGLIAFILSFIMVKIGTHKQIVRLNIILLFAAIILFGISYVRNI